MKTFLFSLLFVCCFNFASSQIDIKTYYENTDNGYIYYADNNEAIEVSLKVEFKLNNLKSSEDMNQVFLLPANTKKIKITTLKTVKKGKYGVSGKTWYNYGNHNKKDYDKDFKYYLPYNKNESYILSQGYNGTISHHNKNQLDFTMPIGTEIVAARDGLVVKVVDVYNKSCAKKECQKYNNYINILHNDGTFAEYLHIKRKGAKVALGDRVKQGQLIALSGNVGYSTGPHLHFSVYFQRLEKREFLETKFKINNGASAVLLKPKQVYARQYD